MERILAETLRAKEGPHRAPPNPTSCPTPTAETSVATVWATRTGASVKAGWMVPPQLSPCAQGVSMLLSPPSDRLQPEPRWYCLEGATAGAKPWTPCRGLTDSAPKTRWVLGHALRGAAH